MIWKNSCIFSLLDICITSIHAGNIVKVLVIWTCLFHGMAQAEFEHDGKGGSGADSEFPEQGGFKPGGDEDIKKTIGGSCRVRPAALANFANGEGYDYSSLVTFLTSPDCIAAAPEISQQSTSGGVDFSNKVPFRFDLWSKNMSKGNLESNKRTDISLRQNIPSLIRKSSVSTSEMLPIVGQLALLSPSASRYALAWVIDQELKAGDELLSMSRGASRESAAISLAKTLVKLGASEGPIASEMAESVEDKALLAQADSLAAYFRALAAAASVEASLVPTFNLSAGALNRGIQKGNRSYKNDIASKLLVSVFMAIRSAVMGNASLEPGAAEMDDALGALLNGAPLTITSLKKMWKDSVRILSISSSQNALADAVAQSLTPEFVFLLPNHQEHLMTASKNYPQIAGAVQKTFLRSWDKMKEDLHAGGIDIHRFNRIKNKYFRNLVTQILSWDPYLIDIYWLSEVARNNLIQDEDIEKRFPKFVLAFLDRVDRASKLAMAENSLEPTVSSLTENFAVVWVLSSIHVPALTEWVEKYEK